MPNTAAADQASGHSMPWLQRCTDYQSTDDVTGLLQAGMHPSAEADILSVLRCCHVPLTR